MKEEKLEKARLFCMEVKKLAQKYGLSFFLVTEGASITDNNGCDAVHNARICHERWEEEHGFDPKEDWSL